MAVFIHSLNLRSGLSNNFDESHINCWSLWQLWCITDMLHSATLGAFQCPNPNFAKLCDAQCVEAPAELVKKSAQSAREAASSQSSRSARTSDRTAGRDLAQT